MHIVSCIDGINFNQMNNKIIQMTFLFSYNVQIEIKFYHILIVQTK